MIRVCAVLLALGLAAPALAQAPAENEAGRFTMTPVADGTLRLDTRTGRVSHCKKDAAGWTCTSVADERAAYEEEIARLQARLAKVEAELAARSAFTPPSDADLDRAVGFMEKFFRRFLAMIENLKREYAAQSLVTKWPSRRAGAQRLHQGRRVGALEQLVANVDEVDLQIAARGRHVPRRKTSL